MGRCIPPECCKPDGVYADAKTGAWPYNSKKSEYLCDLGGP
jgi:hypothetical protein